MLNRRTLLRLEGALNNGYFQAEDFIVSQRDNGSSSTTIEITYRYDEGFSLSAEFDSGKKDVITETETYPLRSVLGPTIRRNRKEDPITGTMVPGEICTPEEFGAESLGTFLQMVGTWLKLVRTEIDTEPQWRESIAWREGLEQTLEKALAEMQAAPGERFSDTEVQELRNKLDDIESDLTEKLQAVIQDQDELKKKAAELHSMVEFLKAQLSRLDKPTMAKAMSIRFLGWFRRNENRKMLKDGAEILKFVADTTKDFF